MKKIIFLLFFILIISLLLPYFLKMSTKSKSVTFSENFENFTLEEAESNFNNPSNILLPTNNNIHNETDILVEDSFPRSNNNEISNKGSQQIWWHYPIFEVGSYDQITNNIKYDDDEDGHYFSL